VYTGHDTKVGQNKQDPSSMAQKWTPLDVRINQATGFIFVAQLVIVFIMGGFGNQWLTQTGEQVERNCT
jgi:magnesium-transporting ATPase (P-type)